MSTHDLTPPSLGDDPYWTQVVGNTAWCPTCKERCSHPTDGCYKCGYNPVDVAEEHRRRRLAEANEY